MPAKSRAASSKDQSSATIGFEAKLWLTADKLRNNMDAAEQSGARQPTRQGSLTFASEGEKTHRTVDLFGLVYEYFLTRFASAEGKKGGQFYTPSRGVPAISRPTTSLKAIQLVVAPLAVSKPFNSLVQPIFPQREQLANQSRTLATLRDTLLPKILSGEIQCSNGFQI